MESTSSRGHAAQQFRVDGHAQVHIGDQNYYTDSASPPAPFHNKYYEIPRDPSPLFTGREEICEELQNKCLPSSLDSQKRQKRFVIYGLGGSGKTQICLKFAEDHREKFWAIFWIGSSSHADIEHGFSNIAQVCGLQGGADVVRRWLSNLSETWLLIMDNADDPNLDISPYFPRGNRGTIIVTARNPESRIHATVGSYEVGQMATKEAVTLLLTTIGNPGLPSKPTEETATKVVSTLGCLALAIVQAGALIRQGLYRLEEFCDIFSRRRKELMTERAVQGSGDYGYTVYTTWELSLRMIENMQDEVGRDALELLQIFSFLHYEGISEETFHRGWQAWRELGPEGACPEALLRYWPARLLRIEAKEWDPNFFRKALWTLSSYSLISRDKYSLISVHPLVHTWARDRMCYSEMEKIWTTTVLTMAMLSTGDDRIKEYRYRRSLVPHMDACFGLHENGIFHLCEVDPGLADIYFFCAKRFSAIYSEYGQGGKSLRILEKLVDTQKQIFGEEHSSTLESLKDLADQYSQVGRKVEAMQLREKVVTSSKQILGEDHHFTIESIAQLAKSYNNLGRHVEASQLLERAEEASRRTLGDEHRVTLDITNSLASCYDESGRLQEGLQLRKGLVEVAKHKLSQGEPLTLGSMTLLACSYWRLNQQEEESRLMEVVVETAKRTLGEEHAFTFNVILSLAHIYERLGRHQEAGNLAERMLDMSKQLQGEDHSWTVLAAETTEGLKGRHQIIVQSRELRDNFQELRDNFQELYNNNQEIHNNIQKVHNNNQEVHNNIQKVHNNNQEVHNNIQKVHNTNQEVHDYIQEFHDYIQKFRDHIQELVDNIQKLHDNIPELRENLNKVKKEREELVLALAQRLEKEEEERSLISACERFKEPRSRFSQSWQNFRSRSQTRRHAEETSLNQ